MTKQNDCIYIKNCRYFMYNPNIMIKSKCKKHTHTECHYYIYLKQVEKYEKNK